MHYLGGARVYVIDCLAARQNLDAFAITSRPEDAFESVNLNPKGSHHTRCMNLQANIWRVVVPRLS